MRNKYSQKFEEEMYKSAHQKTLNELLNIARDKYKYDITKKQLQLYLSKRQIKYKDYNESKVRNMGADYPIGYEYKKPDGMTLIKVSKNKYEYKQRYIYEKYHNVKLTDKDFIIFLDQNRENFDINNLKKISRQESGILSSQKIFSKNPEITETGVLVAKLMIKTNNLRKELK